MLTFSLAHCYGEQTVKVLPFWSGIESVTRLSRVCILSMPRAMKCMCRKKNGIFGLTGFFNCFTLSTNTLSKTAKPICQQLSSSHYTPSLSLCPESVQTDRDSALDSTIFFMKCVMEQARSVERKSFCFCCLCPFWIGPLPSKLGSVLT